MRSDFSPYFGLRDYGTEGKLWGGDLGCEHAWLDSSTIRKGATNGRTDYGSTLASAGSQQTLAPGISNDHGETKQYRRDQSGTCSKCGAWMGSLGAEPTPELYVQHLVEVFREVHRVLRKDGALWLNLGDSYNAAGRTGHGTRAGVKQGTNRASAAGTDHVRATAPMLKPKDLIGIPWMTAFALRADGWYLRQDIIWHKRNVMPESVLDRCTKSHEYLFMLAKSEKYYYDAFAVREGFSNETLKRYGDGSAKVTGQKYSVLAAPGSTPHGGLRDPMPNQGRNRRDVWTINSEPYPGAHFAVMPQKLVDPCLLAGTSEHGCCSECGAPWRRIREKTDHVNKREPAHAPNSSPTKVDSTGWAPTTRVTDQWQPTCKHPDAELVPATVLDPFAGAGTVGVVALKHRRSAVLLELNPEYCELIRTRLAKVQIGLPLGL